MYFITKSKNSSCFSRSVLVGFVILAAVVQLAWTYPAEDDSSKSKVTSSTTVKPVRHPNYVRLLKRTKADGTEIEEEAGNKDAAETPSASAKAEKPADKIASVVTLPREKLTPEKIKEIIPYLEFNENGSGSSSDSSSFSSSGSRGQSSFFNSGRSSSSSSSSISEVERPRGLAGLFSLLSRPFSALRNFGNRNNNNVDRNSAASAPSPSFKISPTFDNDRVDKDKDSKTSKNDTVSTTKAPSTTTSSSSSSSNNPNGKPGLFGSPGNFVLGMVKAMQSVTQTFESMIQSFVKLFNFNRNNDNSGGSRVNRLFGN